MLSKEMTLEAFLEGKKLVKEAWEHPIVLYVKPSTFDYSLLEQEWEKLPKYSYKQRVLKHNLQQRKGKTIKHLPLPE